MRTVARSITTLLTVALIAPLAGAQQTRGPDKVDEAYTKRILETSRDKRFLTEFVDYLPASDKVPSPLKHFGHIIGEYQVLDKSEDMNKYLESLAKAAPTRAKYWTIGKSEEGRDMSLLVIANEETIKNLDKYKADIASLTDPRKTTQAQAEAIIKRAKPIYWLTSGMHSTETGGPEALMELSYRLIVSENATIKNIRDNVITMITPVVETDGRERVVDAYNYQKKTGVNRGQLMMYWGKYVQHDNNRDGMGQFLALTRNLGKFALDWHPTILHDLHEQQTLLYSSTGTGPYNEGIDAITVDEWWIFAKNDVMEMTKRGVPGVWTYGFYDGWTPNYMFFIAHGKNATGRFYEVQSYCCDSSDMTLNQSKEWYRPNPAQGTFKWSPRANTNMQQSALVFSLNTLAKDRTTYLDNYWRKNQRAVAKGTDGPNFGWVIPASQRRKADAAQLVNDMMDQGMEFHTASSDFTAGGVSVKAGDWIARGDQPFRTIGDIYFSVQRYSNANPSPYDDTGWTLQYTRDVAVVPLTDKSALTQPMKPVVGKVTAPGGVSGTGPVIVVEHSGDNNIITFRYKLKDVKMAAAEEDFDAGGKRFRAGSIIIQNANAQQVGAELTRLGLSGWAMASAPTVRSHDLDIPRILYLHSWSRTQDEGWVRAALETYGVPFTYMGDRDVANMPNLRQNYDVIIYPHTGQSGTAIVGTGPVTGGTPIPYLRRPETPSFGLPDSTSDIRGSMGMQGLFNLYRFVEQGGTVITEGSTSTLFPEYNFTQGVTIQPPEPGLFANGMIVRGDVQDNRSPLAYGIGYNSIGVMYKGGPILNAGGGGGFGGRGGGGGRASTAQNISPMGTDPPGVNHFSPGGVTVAAPAVAGGGRGGRGGGGRGGAGAGELPPGIDPAAAAAAGRGGAGGGGGGGGRGGRGGAGGPGAGAGGAATGPRVVLAFPQDSTQILLSGGISGQSQLAGRAMLVDAPIGQGHVVMFGIRPYWRWQTHGTYIFGFNAILNWNDLGAGRGAPAAANAGGPGN
ncbi:MAG TPA: M14 family zinc carboxypeptidase [Gemmatimonadaceae bacterium]|nr:M14 family zinc carboxypeptidase [Gemmatimonadaceae bacterium]